MKSHLRNLSIVLLAGVFLAACSPARTDLNATSTVIAADIYATQTAKAPTETVTPRPTGTLTPAPTTTATITPNLTATAVNARDQELKATAQFQNTATAMMLLSTEQAEEAAWAQLESDGVLTYSRGKLAEIDDQEESWAQRLWYEWWSFGMDVSDFVLMTHIDWQYPDDANLGAGGCGFVFRLVDQNRHMLISVSPRSRVFLSLMTANGPAAQTVHWEDPVLSRYSSTRPPTSGEAEFWMVAEDDFVTAYIDGQMTTQWYVSATNSGDIGYTILSGTNNAPGTYCKFTRTHIWELIKP